jgi:hypothetical protein
MKKTFLLIVAFVLLSAYCFAQGKPTIEIISPQTGTIVSPGQIIIITVSADPCISNVGIIPQRPLKFSQILRPLEFSVTVPTNTPFGQYTVTAVGVAPRVQEPTFCRFPLNRNTLVLRGSGQWVTHCRLVPFPTAPRLI